MKRSHVNTLTLLQFLVHTQKKRFYNRECMKAAINEKYQVIRTPLQVQLGQMNGSCTYVCMYMLSRKI